MADVSLFSHFRVGARLFRPPRGRDSSVKKSPRRHLTIAYFYTAAYNSMVTEPALQDKFGVYLYDTWGTGTIKLEIFGRAMNWFYKGSPRAANISGNLLLAMVLSIGLNLLWKGLGRGVKWGK